MEDSIHYVIDKNVIRRNFLKRIEKFPLNINSIIDGRWQFYGLGYDLFSIIDKLNINYIYVNNLEEALNIRKFNTKINIILKNIDKEYYYDAIVNNLIITIYDNKQIEDIKALKLKDELSLLLYINSGNNINGLKNAKKTLEMLNDLKYVNVLGAYTTIYKDEKNFDEKVDIFKDSTFFMKKDLIRFVVSDTIIENNATFLGKDLYKNEHGFPEVYLIGKISEVKKVQKGESVCSKKFRKSKNVGIIDTPYKLNIKRVWIRNELYKVLYSCEEYILVEIDDKLKAGTEVELFGINSRNIVSENILYHEIPKYYLDNTDKIRAKYQNF